LPPDFHGVASVTITDAGPPEAVNIALAPSARPDDPAAEMESILKAQKDLDARIRALQEALKKFDEQPLRAEDGAEPGRPEKPEGSAATIRRRLGLELEPIAAEELHPMNQQLRGGLRVTEVLAPAQRPLLAFAWETLCSAWANGKR
jgi:hypothetical protein